MRFRRALRADLPAIVALLADDDLGRARESAAQAVDPVYVAAFEVIAADANQILAVADLGGEVIGCMQITFIPGLSRRGAWRGQLESVRVASHLRGRGIGEQFLDWAIGQCRERGCGLVQLTTDRQRLDALRFYERLGFVPSHNGMKRQL
ncbi:GNAT family N-acetyltransferase [Aestuariicoccus sp. KMU-90]|uniref:GNAT family N-acetyltransferase n=1 Tax=Thetidibacter halocola TaxID=2827239 RepID=A0A8J7WH01_9RHOB|nr:GNAT family N-acetyltransferase [Thetidibacter halocola]